MFEQINERAGMLLVNSALDHLSESRRGVHLRDQEGPEM